MGNQDSEWIQGLMLLKEYMENDDLSEEEANKILDEALEHYGKAVMRAEVGAVQQIQEFSEMNDSMREMFADALEEPVRMLQEEGVTGMAPLGLLYMYGVYFEQDLDKAKECFEKGAKAGLGLCEFYLNNPIFDED